MQYFQIKLIFVSVCLLVHSVQSEECGQEELIQCSHQIQVLTKTSEFNFVDNKQELDKVCPDLHTGLQCIRSYTRRCMSLHQREHFNQLYEGTNQMIHDLCKEGSYQEDFLLHAPCMRKVKNDYDICSKSYQYTMSKITEEQSVTEPAIISTTTAVPFFQRHQQHHRNDSRHNNSLFVSMETTTMGTPRNNTSNQSNEENHIKTVCCAFQKYMECSEIAVARECGPETAEFTRKFLDKMLSSLMRMHCETPERKCDDYYSSSQLTFNFSKSIILMSSLLVLVKLQ